MKNQNPQFVQIRKNLIVRVNSITVFCYDEGEKNYMLRVDGDTWRLTKEEAEPILEKFLIKL